MKSAHATVAAFTAALLSASLELTAQNTGCAFDLNVDGYIEVPYSPLVAPQSGITVEAWFTYDDALVPATWRYPTLLRQGISVGGSENWFLRMNCNNNAARVLRWKVVTTSGAGIVVDYQFAPAQFLNWTHVAASYDGAEARLYVDGQLVGSTPGNGEAIRDINSEVLRIGKGSDVATPIEVWNGELDEVRLWPFARSEEDIQQSMNLELQSIPGYVSTWNLNNDFSDSSGTLGATASGQVTFTANSLALQPSTLQFGLSQGASTPGCAGDILLTPSGPSVVNYNDFRVVATRVQPGVPVFWGASGGVLGSPLPLLGVDVWVDPTGLILLGNTADALGSASVPIAIPGNVSGVSFSIQCLALDTCGSQGFAASDAMIVIVQ